MYRRAIIGVLAIVCLACFFLPTDTQGLRVARAACIKVGFVLAAAWAAYPDLQRVPGWLVVMGMISIGLIIWRPPLAVIVIPVLVAVWFLRPRNAQKSKES